MAQSCVPDADICLEEETALRSFVLTHAFLHESFVHPFQRTRVIFHMHILWFCRIGGLLTQCAEFDGPVI